MGQLKGLRVVRSNIHGYGVIATEPIPAGAIVCTGDGVLWQEDDDFDDTYALILNAADVVDGEVARANDRRTLFWDLADQTRWINHACDPNTEVDARYVPSRNEVHARWVALRPIAAGEELTYDYAFAAQVAEPCACGAPSCRGVIVDPDEISKLAPKLAAMIRR